MIKTLFILLILIFLPDKNYSKEEIEAEAVVKAEDAIAEQDYRLIEVAYQLARVVEGLECKKRIPEKIIKETFFYSDVVTEYNDLANWQEYAFAVAYNQKIASDKNYPYLKYCKIE